LAELGQGDYKKAENILPDVLNARPDYTPAHVALGAVHLRRRHFETARKTLEQVLAEEPDNGIAHYLLGYGYLNQLELEQAATSLRAAVAIDSTAWVAQYALARAYRLGGDFNQAAQVYQAITARQPDPFEAHYQLASLLKLVSDQIYFQLRGDEEKAPPFGIDVRRWKAHLSQSQAAATKFSQLALSQFARALEVRPADPQTVRQVSESYRRAGRLAEARQYFEWLAQRQPDQWIPLYRLGTIRLQLEEYEEAIGQWHFLKKQVINLQ
jgi:tetratricopeptide (TPR) repeat protein